MCITLEQDLQIIEDIYAENDKIAEETRKHFDERRVLCINVMGSPGAGKTTSIINISKDFPQGKVCVVEGDIESDIDTKKLKDLGIDAIQLNTHGACHLDAPMIQNLLPNLPIDQSNLIFIENIGNLVCPAEFQIGEQIKMLICSVAEGSDKPYKYPLAFEKANVIVLTKCDLKQHVDFNDEFFYKGVRALNKNVPIFEVNGKTGQGFNELINWCERTRANL